MEKKIMILLMSCNDELYLKEEQACRDTFLKDAEKAGIPYFFYRGGKEGDFDEENHVIYAPVPDDLANTAKKTTWALSWAYENFPETDYFIKTNVSTWLDIKKIVEAVESLEGKPDLNIYGARFLANETSRRVPFPRGHFVILSGSLLKGVKEIAPLLVGRDSLPKTDDTLLCLAMLYYIQKKLGDNYLTKLKEVPSVCEWREDIESAPEYNEALAIRCKDEKDNGSTPNNMLIVHSLKHKRTKPKKYFRKVNMIETKYGMMTYERYTKFNEAVDEAKKRGQQVTATTVNNETVVKRTDGPNKLEEIRKKLEGIRK